MKNLNSKESLMRYLSSKIELTGFISEIDINTLDYCDIVKNKEEYLVTEHLVISAQEKELIIKYFGDIKSFAKDSNIDFISEEFNKNPIEFIHLTGIRYKGSIMKKGLVSDYCSQEADLGFGIYVVESDCYKGLDNVKTFFEDYSEDDILVVKGKYDSLYTKCIYGLGHEGYIVLSESVKPSSLSLEIMSVEDFLCL